MINRNDVYQDVLQLFDSDQVMREYPLRIMFKGELAVDTGGVCRDMFSAFWEVAYTNCCDGDSLLVPLVHPGSDCDIFSKIGRILSHGYLQCGFLPLRIAFPTLASMLLGTNISIPDSLLVSTFIDALNTHEQGLLRKGLNAKGPVFSEDLQTKLVAIISRFGGRQVPTPLNLKNLVIQLAKYQFQSKPMIATVAAHSGIPDFERPFWESRGVGGVHSIYMSLVATSAKVLAMIEEPDGMNASENRIFTYLTQMVGDMKPQELATFLRFLSGSSVCLGKKVTITFNNLCGLSRRPIAHTCDCTLELSVSYVSYVEFTNEFRTILGDTEFTWSMNAI